MGTVTHIAKVLSDFVPEEELLPVTQAICKVFTRLGEKRNRNRARIKFLVEKLGIEEFTRLVNEEREKLPDDPRWTAYLDGLENFTEKPSREPAPLAEQIELEGFKEWFETNIYSQRQEGYCVVTLNLTPW